MVVINFVQINIITVSKKVAGNNDDITKHIHT